LSALEQLAADAHDELELRAGGHVSPSASRRTGTASVDYPDFAVQVAEAVAAGRAERGILVCGSGVGMAIAANKVKGVRAALCHDSWAGRCARQHNDANVLCLGSWCVGRGVAEDIVRAFLVAEFEGGRHKTRVDKIRAMES